MVAELITLRQRLLSDPRWGKLTDDQRILVEARVAMLLRIDGQRNKRRAFIAESRRSHAGEVWSPNTIRKAYYAWVDAGRDWYAARNKSLAPEVAVELPQATVDFWHERCARFGGKHAAAYRSIARDWEQGNPIPGLEECVWTPELPRGLSYSNLMRKKYRPSEAQDRVASIGPRALHDITPGVLTTRYGLQGGDYYVFDDIWHDLEVSVTGQIGSRRLLQFHCLELLSACQVGRGMKPEILNDRTGRMERLKESELLFLLAHILGNLGYNPLRCTLNMEHGTASISERVERILFDASGGVITVARGGMTDSALAKGLYAGAGRGNFKFKAALESLGNLIHNETADRMALPMQTGSNARLNCPDEHHGREQHLTQLQTAALTLPPELRDLVKYPAPPLRISVELLDRIQEAINDRKAHDLEGWEECGFVQQEYHLHAQQPWQAITQLAEMPETLQAAIRAAIAADPMLIRARRMSPREVFEQRVRPQLVRLRPHVIPLIVGMEYAQEKAVQKDGRVCFEDMEVGPGEHIFEGIVHDEEGHKTPLRPGEKYAVFASTIDRERLHLCDAKGRYVGWCLREDRIQRGDAEAFAKAAGRKMQRTREIIAPALRAGRALIQRDADAAEANAAIFSAGEPASTPARKAARARLQKHNTQFLASAEYSARLKNSEG